MALANIAASWFASPILSGTVSAAIFWLLRKSVLQSSKPFEQGLNILPIAYGLTVAVNVMSIALDGPKREYFNELHTMFQYQKKYITYMVFRYADYIILVFLQFQMNKQINKYDCPLKEFFIR